MKCMQTAELKTFKTERNTLTVRKGSPLVVIDDESLLPDELVNVKTIVTPDKLKIKEAIEAGDNVKGAHIEIGESSLQVR